MPLTEVSYNSCELIPGAFAVHHLIVSLTIDPGVRGQEARHFLSSRVSYFHEYPISVRKMSDFADVGSFDHGGSSYQAMTQSHDTGGYDNGGNDLWYSNSTAFTQDASAVAVPPWPPYLSILRQVSRVDYDSLNPYHPAAQLGPFEDCTSNQAIAWAALG